MTFAELTLLGAAAVITYDALQHSLPGRWASPMGGLPLGTGLLYTSASFLAPLRRSGEPALAAGTRDP